MASSTKNGEDPSTVNVNGETKQSNSNSTAPSTPAPTVATETPELTNAQKKALAKAEKAARRAQEKAAPESAPVAAAATVGPSGEAAHMRQASQDIIKAPARRASMAKDPKGHTTTTTTAVSSKTSTKTTASTSQSAKPDRSLPIRRRLSQSVSQETRQDNKQVSFFSHLYGQPRRSAIEGSAKEVHPAILALGLQLSSYVICGSHARCVAMLLALKSVIKTYTTPHGTSLPRHLSSTHLSPQLAHIKSSRPFSTTQSNSIRWLKNLIANIDPSTEEPLAKTSICTAIDAFVRERFTIADRVIAENVAERVRDGDVVLTYAKSAVVLKALVEAAARGKKLRVVCVDSRPLFEGKNLARTLSQIHGVDVTYCFTSGLAHAARDVTLCLLGAHAVLGNGRVYSRVGMASVAMMAKERGVPVVVCAESIKFTERVALDSVVANELAPEDELVIMDEDVATRSLPPPQEKAKGTVGSGGDDLELSSNSSLKGWREKDGLQLLNLMYDVTPAEYIDMIVTEFGPLPPTSAPQVQRMSVGS